MVPFSNLLIALADVPDPRRAQGKRYPLPHLLLFTVLALLSAARSYRGVITFLEQRRQHLNDHFAVALKRAPAVNTLRTVLQSVSSEALEQAFRRHAEGLLPAPEAGYSSLWTATPSRRDKPSPCISRRDTPRLRGRLPR